MKVVDAEGHTVAPGVAGEFCTRGYSVMLGYWNDPEKTHEAIDADGWMHTGDLGTLDAEGYGNVVGRSKDMAIRGGETSIRSRSRTSFTSTPPSPTPRSSAYPIRTWARNSAPGSASSPEPTSRRRRFAPSCAPTSPTSRCHGYVRFVSEFPTTVTGKVQKFVMRARMIEELGLTVQATA